MFELEKYLHPKPKTLYDVNDQMQKLLNKYSNQVPIKKGCPNKQCFCTGACNEIIGWRDKLVGEW